MKGPVEPVHRSVPESIQEVIELTGFHCFLFCSTPNLGANKLHTGLIWAIYSSGLGHGLGTFLYP